MNVVYLPLSWNTYLKHIRHLANLLLKQKIPLDLIVAVSRGGLTLGHVLSDYLRLPIWTIAIQSYTDIQTQGEIKITGKLQTSIRNRKILLVDDVADSGKTYLRALGYLKRCKPAATTTLSVFYKPHSTYKPDFLADTTSKWILFPYETTEMILLLSKKMRQRGKSLADIREFLISLNFEVEQIAFVFKYHPLI